MKGVLMIIAVLIFACGSLFVQVESAEADSFHKAAVKSPAPGTIFLYPERIPPKNGGFFAATGDMSELPDEVEMLPVDWVIPESAKKKENK